MIRTTFLAIALLPTLTVRVQAQSYPQNTTSSVGTIGQRQSREKAVDSVVVTQRIAGRIQSRIESRIRNRIDRDYVSPSETTSAIAAAQNQARTATTRTP